MTLKISTLIFFTFLFSKSVFSQIDYSKHWIKSGWEYKSKDDIEKDFTKKVICKDDLSYILIQDYPSHKQNLQIPMYGVFGEQYKKVELYFAKVIKSTKNSKKYIVKGQSKLQDKISDFKGIIHLKKAIAYIPTERSPEDYTAIVVTGTYVLEEYPKEKGNGIFKGGLKIVLFPKDINAKKISYDLDAWYEQGAIKAYVGTFKEYNTKKKYKCLFGFPRFNEYTEDFDTGIGESFINIKYAKTWFNFSEKQWDSIKKTGEKSIHIFTSGKAYIEPEDTTWYKKNKKQ